MGGFEVTVSRNNRGTQPNFFSKAQKYILPSLRRFLVYLLSMISFIQGLLMCLGLTLTL